VPLVAEGEGEEKKKQGEKKKPRRGDFWYFTLFMISRPLPSDKSSRFFEKKSSRCKKTT